MEQFKHAIVYGQSVKHQPQRVGLSHELADEDISKYEVSPSSSEILMLGSNNHQTMTFLLDRKPYDKDEAAKHEFAL